MIWFSDIECSVLYTLVNNHDEVEDDDGHDDGHDDDDDDDDDDDHDPDNLIDFGMQQIARVSNL